MTNYWLIKSEPDAYSIDDLKKDKKTGWDGVRNYQARNFMRDQMRKGDLALFYHSNTKPPGIVGICKVCSTPYPDPTAFDSNSKYFDPKSKKDSPTWMMVDFEFVDKFPRILSLDELKTDPKLSELMILRKGNRLSITPVGSSEFNHIRNSLSQSF